MLAHVCMWITSVNFLTKFFGPTKGLLNREHCLHTQWIPLDIPASTCSRESCFEERWENVSVDKIGDCAIGSYFLVDCVREYRVFLRDELPNMLEEVPLHMRCRIWNQRDGATAHWGTSVWRYLNATCPRLDSMSSFCALYCCGLKRLNLINGQRKLSYVQIFSDINLTKTQMPVV